MDQTAESKEPRWRKSANASVDFFGIESFKVSDNSRNEGITSLRIDTSGTVVGFVAFDDDVARETIEKLRNALDVWDALLYDRAKARQAPEVVNA